MSLKSENNRFAHLMETEDISTIEFVDGYDRNDLEQNGGGDNSSDVEIPDIDYLFTTERKQTGGNNDIERDFFQIYNNAREYSNKLKNIAGGSGKIDLHISEETPKLTGGSDRYDDWVPTDVGLSDTMSGGGKAMPPIIMALHKIAKVLKETNEMKAGINNETIPKNHILKVAKFVYQDAEKIIGDKNKLKEIEDKAVSLAKSPSKYINEYKAMPQVPKKEKKQRKKKEKTTKVETKLYGGYY